MEAKRQKRAAGEGTLCLVTRKNGRQVWRAGETVTLLAGSKPQRIFGEGPTRQAAREALRRNITRKQVQLGELPPTALRALTQPTGALTVEQHFRAWLLRKNIKESTRNQYETQLRLYLYPYFGSVPLATVSMEEAEGHFQGTLKALTNPTTKKPLLGDSAYRAVLKLVKSGFQAAVVEGKMGVNPLARVKVPPQRKRTLSEQEQLVAYTQWVPEQLLKVSEGTEDDARWILALMGVRQGEALGLTWDKVKWSKTKGKSRLLIEQQVVRRHKKHGCPTDARGRWTCGRQADYCPQATGASGLYLDDSLKNEASARPLALVEPLYTALKRWQALQEEWRRGPEWDPLPGLENLVFTTRTGKPRRPQEDRRLWKKLLEEAGVPQELRVHDARHFAASLMISMPEHFTAEQVTRVGGWKNTGVLMETYTHVGASFTAKGLEAYGERIGKRRKGKGES